MSSPQALLVGGGLASLLTDFSIVTSFQQLHLWPEVCFACVTLSRSCALGEPHIGVKLRYGCAAGGLAGAGATAVSIGLWLHACP
eukprot:8511784-Pyramimonas_sp.AAC.1